MIYRGYDMKKHIVIITPGGLPVPSVHGGAVQNLIEELINESFCPEDIKFSIISPYDKDAKIVADTKYKDTQFNFVRIPKLILLIDKIIYWGVKKLFRKKKALSARSLFKSFWFTLKSSFILKTNDYDLVVLENNIMLCWCLKLFKNYKKYYGKYILHLHNVPRYSAGCKDIILNANKILCVSNYVGQCIQEVNSSIGQIPQEKVSTLYNCIDTNKFHNTVHTQNEINELKKIYGIKTEKVIIFVGRLSEEKGIMELLKALQLVKYENYKLLIVGACFYGLKIQGTFENTLKELAKSKKDKIIFTGYIDYDKIPLIYSLADIAVLPSMWEEPAGLTIVEAMASGLAVITTQSGGIPEYTSWESSIILNKNDIVNQLAENIDYLFNNPEVLSKYASNASKRAKDFDTSNYLSNFCNIVFERR